MDNLSTPFRLTPLVLTTILLLFSVFSVLGINYFGITFGLGIFIVLIGLPLVFSVIYYPKFGILVLLIAAYFVMFVLRIGVNFPLGTLMDGLVLLLGFGFIIYQKKYQKWEAFRNPISVMILVWIGYNLLQVLNPEAASKMAWLYTIRSVALIMLTYFVFVAQIRTKEFIRLIFSVWIFLAFFAALYAVKQEYIGFFGFEEASINTELQRSLLFIDGKWRKFSIFSDPVSFSYNMVISAILCVALMLNPMKTYKKVILGCLAALFLTTMLYSGTRGAYPLFPLAMFLFVVLRFNFKILKYAIVGAAFFIALVFVPTSNPTILRFQSAFSPDDDASFNVRKINQKKIQPYIQQHPFGGGLGATGVWGKRFAPNSELANFPSDSGYVRVAVELGYVGMFIFCTFMFVVLKTGIENYYIIKDIELKNYCLGMVLIIFALGIGNYPQEALVQFPNSVYFYLAVAMINITLIIDKRDSKNVALKHKEYEALD
jgi:putative inorganic carbon (HCO3(-)) transporter